MRLCVQLSISPQPLTFPLRPSLICVWFSSPSCISTSCTKCNTAVSPASQKTGYRPLPYVACNRDLIPDTSYLRMTDPAGGPSKKGTPVLRYLHADGTTCMPDSTHTASVYPCHGCEKPSDEVELFDSSGDDSACFISCTTFNDKKLDSVSDPRTVHTGLRSRTGCTLLMHMHMSPLCVSSCVAPASSHGTRQTTTTSSISSTSPFPRLLSFLSPLFYLRQMPQMLYHLFDDVDGRQRHPPAVSCVHPGFDQEDPLSSLAGSRRWKEQEGCACREVAPLRWDQLNLEQHPLNIHPPVPWLR